MSRGDKIGYALITLFALTCLVPLASCAIDLCWYIWTRHHLFCGLAAPSDPYCHRGVSP